MLSTHMRSDHLLVISLLLLFIAIQLKAQFLTLAKQRYCFIVNRFAYAITLISFAFNFKNGKKSGVSTRFFM